MEIALPPLLFLSLSSFYVKVKGFSILAGGGGGGCVDGGKKNKEKNIFVK
jgi:hypothetical protein